MKKLKVANQASRAITLVIALVCGLQKNSLAHHAMEYIEMESYTTAKKNEFIFRVHYDYMVDDVENPALDHWEITPGISYGITDRLMFDVHTHFAKFGPGHLVVDLESPKYKKYSTNGPPPFIEAVATYLQFRITRENQLPVNVAVSAFYEYPLPRSRELLGGQQVFGGTLILSRDLGEHSNVCLNLTVGKDGDELMRELALGAKAPLTKDPHGISAGIEFLLEDVTDIRESWSVLPGVYAPLAENIIFKTGLQVGKTTLRTNLTLMYRF